MLRSIGIILAAAGFAIQQPTGNRRVIDKVGILVLKFMQAALATTVTKGFPFLRRHLLQRFGFPKPGVFRFMRWLSHRLSRPALFYYFLIVAYGGLPNRKDRQSKLLTDQMKERAENTSLHQTGTDKIITSCCSHFAKGRTFGFDRRGIVKLMPAQDRSNRPQSCRLGQNQCPISQMQFAIRKTRDKWQKPKHLVMSA